MMPAVAHPYPPRCLLRAVWTVDPLPADYLTWREANIRLAIAYHEAAHALLMFGHGVPGIEARLSEDGTDGEVFHQAGLHATLPVQPIAMERTSALMAATIYHAGIEGEQLVGDFCPPMGTEWRCATTTDHEQATAVFSELFFRGQPHGYSKAVARAALAQNRTALDRIAGHLYDTGAWHPADTPGIDINLNEAFAAIAAACHAYGEPAEFSPGAGEMESLHSPHQAWGPRGHVMRLTAGSC